MLMTSAFPCPAIPRREVNIRDAIAFAALRRPPRPTDFRLDTTAERWLRSLPAHRRPHRLAADYPRVANRLAWCAHEPELFAQALQDLIADRRGGRRGFPAQVVRELKRLR